MSENRFEALVGAVVLVIAAIFFLYLTNDREWFGTGSGYEVRARFSSAQGISEGAQVRMAGVTVGSVTGITLDPESYFALVNIKVADHVLIPEDSTAAVAAESILGGQYIEISPGGAVEGLEAGDIIIDTQGYIGLVDLLTNFFFSQDQ